MSVVTYISRSRIEDVMDHKVTCPHCGDLMVVREYYHLKKNKLVLVTCICYNGCLNVDPEPGEFKEYFFVAYDLEDCYRVAERLKNKAK